MNCQNETVLVVLLADPSDSLSERFPSLRQVNRKVVSYARSNYGKSKSLAKSSNNTKRSPAAHRVIDRTERAPFRTFQHMHGF